MKADEVASKEITESKNSFDRLTSIILQTYSEINKVEIIIAAGAFSLIINFFIQRGNETPYTQVGFLKFSVFFLFLLIVWKNHLSRSAAKKAEQERRIINDRLNLFRDIHAVNVEFLINNNNNILLKAPGILQKMDLIDQEFKEMNSPKTVERRNLFNEIEYVLFFCGTGLLLIFFLFNI